MLYADLKVLSGRHQGKVISLTMKKFLVGRGEDCHLRPNTDLVSRHHCVFNLDDYSVRLRDLGSTNGTFVNDQQIRGQVELKTGDKIRIGKLDLEVIVKEGAPVAVGAVEEPPHETIPVEEAVVDEGYQEFAQQPGTETIHDTGMLAEADTSYFPPGQTPPPPLQYAPGNYPPPGYGYPPQGYMPQQMPPGQYMYPYPPMQGGYPQYPQMMPGGYPQYPPMGYPPQQQPPQQQYYAPVEEPVEEEVPAKKPAKEVNFQLPDPAETGVKEVPVGEKKDGKKMERTENPSAMAQDIIQQYMRRRPGS